MMDPLFLFKNSAIIEFKLRIGLPTQCVLICRDIKVKIKPILISNDESLFDFCLSTYKKKEMVALFRILLATHY